MAGIYVCWIGEGEEATPLIEEMRTCAEALLDTRARVWSMNERPADAFDPRRQQHSSTRILRWLLERRPVGADKILAITDKDLFIPVLTFVFGEALLDGGAAVVSTARLRVDPRGQPATIRLLATRLIKVGLHELGHTYGLIHCEDTRCIMARSVTVADVDAKQWRLCHDCQLLLEYLRWREGNE